ncbi:MAG TPA: metallophosphoesterase [Muribaculum sp.]|uniref:Metallophosphoesterase n=2 Tax=Bacteroidales TaxID=171549 RepID=A0ABV4CVG4_9BACT|nr:phosphoesterase [bacterium J10(2018)]HRF68659.1 metallophosphoesterase [Muribaculum sp.]
MSNVYFTSDLHLGHRRILELYQWRPFAQMGDIEAHDNKLIELWNSTVSKHDMVYILGDFSLKSANENRKILERLNGYKYLCPGNHDSSLKSLSNYFEKVEQIMIAKFKKEIYTFLQSDMEFVLCHYPLVEWAGMHHGVFHLHGHCHGQCETPDPRRIDVGIDSTKSILISLEEVLMHFNLTLGTPVESE